MPISRDPRMDRRRRVLRECSEDNAKETSGNRSRSRKSAGKDVAEVSPNRKGAGYSQDVRKACGHRLVQLIPVRRRSYAAFIAVSLLVPGLLLTAHYMIYVSGSLPWYGHPLALALDASHPRSIAAWLSSHLWLLCLAATILTFQLRRHKLDDYNGEYRLWFWLVLTCLLASVDSTSQISQLFGLALDHWSQVNLGWSGPAVVQATLAVLVGMLGLRLCSELKAVPTSLILWLIGLVAWAGSAALGQEQLKIDLTIQFRIWLRAALWLGGLTAIWLAALAYLRHIYIEAQRRFLLRGRMAASHDVPLGRRIRESLPAMPALPSFRRGDAARDSAETSDSPSRSRWGLSALRRGKPDEVTREKPTPRPKSGPKAVSPKSDRSDETAKATVASGASESEPKAAAPRRGLKGFLGKSQPATETQPNQVAKQSDAPKRSRLTGWLRAPKDSDEAEEYQKVPKNHSKPPKQAKSTTNQNQEGKKNRNQQDDGDESTARRRWLPKLPRPKMPKVPRVKTPSLPKPSGLLAKLKLPKFKLPSLRLPPPAGSEAADSANTQIRPVKSDQPLPGTQARDPSDSPQASRPLTKAERKRLRRQQQSGRKAA